MSDSSQFCAYRKYVTIRAILCNKPLDDGPQLNCHLECDVGFLAGGRTLTSCINGAWDTILYTKNCHESYHENDSATQIWKGDMYKLLRGVP